jgi:hypothetical protein
MGITQLLTGRIGFRSGLHYSEVMILPLFLLTPLLSCDMKDSAEGVLGSLLTVGPDKCTAAGLGDCRIGISFSMSHHSLGLHIGQVRPSSTGQSILSLHKCPGLTFPDEIRA